MDAETARKIVNGCAALPICVYRIAVLAGGSIFLGPLLIIIGWTDLRHRASVCHGLCAREFGGRARRRYREPAYAADRRTAVGR
jgi:hypothetical protein